MNPMLSVILPTFNGERYVAAALESVCTQAASDIEVIVVDDGSTDATLKIVDSFSERLAIRVLTPGRLGSWVAATNIGLRAARGEWACFLHQDDVWLPGRIVRIRPALADGKHSLILHNAIFIGPDGKKLGRWNCPLRHGSVPPDRLLGCLLVQNFIAIPSPVFRRALAIESGCLDENLWFSADWDLWLRLGSAGPTLFIDEVLAGFRIHAASQTAARKVESGEWEKQLTTVLERHLPHWQVNGSERKAVERMASASVAVNSTLSAASRGESASMPSLLRQLLSLGPLGFAGYVRRSRIHERVWARLRVKST
jgi:glycosyltransferase involved in cell wall biosynthesis